VDIQQLDRLYDLIKEGGGDAETKNERLLKMANLLLEDVDFSSKALGAYSSEKVLLLLFSAYSKIAHKSADFYSSAENFLNPAKKAGDFGQKLETCIAQNKAVSDKITEIEKLEKELLEKERQLIKRKKEYEELQEKVRYLAILRDEATPEKLSAAKLANAEEEKRLNTIRDEMERAKKENVRLQEQVRVINETKIIEDKANSQLICDINAKIASIASDIRQKLIIHSGNLLEFEEQVKNDISKYNNMREELRVLSERHTEVNNEYKKALDFYKLHLGENTNIANALRMLNIPSISELLGKSDNTTNMISEQLAIFDKLLDAICALNENERARITQLTNVF